MDWFLYAILLGACVLLGMLVVAHVAHYRVLRRIDERDARRAAREFKDRLGFRR